MNLFDTILGEEFTVSQGATVVSQAEKIRRLAPLILERLYRNGTCPLADLEADALAIGLSGRVSLQLGKGVGGKGGLNLWRDDQKGVLCCRDNVVNCSRRFTSDSFNSFLEKLGLTEEEFEEWFTKLPSAS